MQDGSIGQRSVSPAQVSQEDGQIHSDPLGSQILTCRIRSGRSSWLCGRRDNGGRRERLCARQGVCLADRGDLARKRDQLTAQQVGKEGKAQIDILWLS